MKLYTRGQVILIVSSIVAVLFLIGLGFGIVRFPDNTASDFDSSRAGAAGGGETQDLEVEPYRLETNPVTDVIPVQSTAAYSEDEKNNIRVYERINKAVVNISTKVVGLNWFLEPVPREGGSGSGSIIDERGYVLTNRHVVEKAYEVLITLHNGRQYTGEVVGTDSENDLAVVKFDPEGMELVTIPMGSSSDLMVGQKVLAIGNPFGYDRTLTTGIVSGVGRPVKVDTNLIIRDMIQTDASINPGNSGGPLINTRGEMIGINTMIFSPSGGSVGIGFAVSVDTAKRVVPDLIEYGAVQRGWIDAVMVQLFPELVRYAELPVSEGLLVSRVIDGGNADRAGIRGGNIPVRYGRSTIYIGGDVIIEVDGIGIRTWSDLYNALEDNRPGETVEVVVLREGNRKSFRVELAVRSERYELE
ncbi:MAG: S1C family serine protease [Spirochaetia bacterium]